MITLLVGIGGLILFVISIILLIRYFSASGVLLTLVKSEEPDLWNALHQPRILPNGDSLARPFAFLKGAFSYTLWVISGGRGAEKENTTHCARKVRYLLLLALVTLVLGILFPSMFVLGISPRF